MSAASTSNKTASKLGEVIVGVPSSLGGSYPPLDITVPANSSGQYTQLEAAPAGRGQSISVNPGSVSTISEVGSGPPARAMRGGTHNGVRGSTPGVTRGVTRGVTPGVTSANTPAGSTIRPATDILAGPNSRAAKPAAGKGYGDVIISVPSALQAQYQSSKAEAAPVGRYLTIAVNPGAVNTSIDGSSTGGNSGSNNGNQQQPAVSMIRGDVILSVPPLEGFPSNFVTTSSGYPTAPQQTPSLAAAETLFPILPTANTGNTPTIPLNVAPARSGVSISVNSSQVLIPSIATITSNIIPGRLSVLNPGLVNTAVSV